MARRDTRSPSPVGSSYSSSRRHRRDDDRHAKDRRDDGRGQRDRRSRSRSAEVRFHEHEQRIIFTHTPGLQRRYRDRDSHRRHDRSVERHKDRRDEDNYRPGRRDRSRERHRSRSPRGGRRRSRDYRDRRDDSRDRDRRRPDDSADSKRRARRDSREISHKAEEVCQPPTSSIRMLIGQTPASTANKMTDEEKKKAGRLAKLETWKAKQNAEKKLKEAQSSAGARNILDEMDKKAIASPTLASPGSPAVTSGAASPIIPYSGKFDPKAVAKRAAVNNAASVALGIDVAVPTNAKSAELKKPITGISANKPKAGTGTSLGTLDREDQIANTNNFSAKSLQLKASGNLSGFGLSGRSAEVEKKKGLDFGDEESTHRKLEKLPTLPIEDDQEDSAQANADEDVNDDDDDDVDMDEAGSEEEALAAARAAAEKREERLQLEAAAMDVSEDQTAPVDTQMVDASEVNGEKEEVDPLDAFMAGLDPSTDTKLKRKPTMSKKGKISEPEAMFGDEDEGAAEDMDAVDATPDDILAMASKKKKRDIPTVDHKKMQYESYRKNFYSEPTEMADMTEEDIADIRLELDGIKVRGVDVPKPVIKWAQCGLGVQTLDVIRSLGFETPTSIQSQAIPAIMSGRDVIGVAKTGSGKTIAFLLPMFRHIKDQRSLDSMDGPIALVMSPTRELATQIHRECKPFMKALNLRAVCAYGGAPIKDQIADLKRGAEIMVCTPGRMIELLSANSGRVTNLRRVTYVVLDEADRMFDMGFEPQVMKIIGNIRPDKQTVLFSATFPRNMEALARKTLAKPIEIIVGGRSVVAPEITQIVEVRSENTKFVRLLELLGELYDKDEDARTLIFVDRQDSADGLLRELMRKGYPCNSIHGGKDQIDRDSTIDDFKAGVIPIMIATSVAARGLDVKQLKLVINYDAPNHLEDYVHRAGRTGRAGNTGTAVTFVTEEQDRYAVDIAKALKYSGQPVPDEIQKLANIFIDKVKAGKAKASGSGFGGKGLEKLDQERDAARNRERKAYRTGDEPEEEEKEEAKEDDIVVVVKPAVTATPVASTIFPKALDESSIVVHKTEIVKVDSSNPLDKVRAAVANIGDRLNKRNQLNPGHPIDNKGPDAGAFHATLEINDFPQKARWAVTNRTNVAKILEATGTSITTKGNFYAAGKEPGPNDMPKLYILVEGDTEIVVTNAMKELMRLLREGTIQAADIEARAPASGRYNVV
jgi:ATP-dependent RNA helicase DDX46/PRP5